jgi:hypothetical protein
MSAISPKADFRLNRIKMVSRVVRVPMLAMFLYLAFFGIFQVGRGGSGFYIFLANLSTWFPTANHSTGVPTYILSLAWIDDLIDAPGIAIISAIGFWKLAKLFRFYERGLIFTSETVRCIKFLGVLCAVQWMLQVIHHFLFSNYLAPWFQSTLPPKFTGHIRDMSFNNPFFFSFPIGNINFGLLLAGIVIVLIAWVMDEGRKIREEQELTV